MQYSVPPRLKLVAGEVTTPPSTAVPSRISVTDRSPPPSFCATATPASASSASPATAHVHTRRVMVSLPSCPSAGAAALEPCGGYERPVPMETPSIVDGERKGLHLGEVSEDSVLRLAQLLERLDLQLA